jgi:peptide/nickel transport system permease protein
MLIFFCQRLLQGALAIAALSLAIFGAVYAIGNPVDMLISPDADQLDRARITAALGLDKSLPEQYWLFLNRALHGDMGMSFSASAPAMHLILERMPATMELAVAAILIALILGVPLGLWSGLHPASISGKSISALSILGFSLPSFWIGMLLIKLFAVQLGWLPPSGRGPTDVLFGVPVSFLSVSGLQHLLLPAVNLALFNIALLIRLTKAGTQEAMLQDYVRFARAKGVRERRIVGVHVLKNIAIPIITVIGMQFGAVLAFAIVTESVFSWPGMGKLLIDSLTTLDRPVIVAYILLIATVFIVINMVVDILYFMLDPRMRRPGAREK